MAKSYKMKKINNPLSKLSNLNKADKKTSYTITTKPRGFGKYK